MPGLNGLEAAAAIRRAEASFAKPPVPIVAVTANVFDGDRRRCLEAGMTAFLAKPFRAEDFRTVVAPLLEAARSTSAGGVTNALAAKAAPKQPASKVRRRTPIGAGA
jgi:DNA-binding response OmpR family regulator